MLLIRELARLVRDVTMQAAATRRFAVLVAVAAVAAVIVLATSVTHLVPVAVYPFI